MKRICRFVSSQNADFAVATHPPTHTQSRSYSGGDALFYFLHVLACRIDSRCLWDSSAVGELNRRARGNSFGRHIPEMSHGISESLTDKVFLKCRITRAFNKKPAAARRQTDRQTNGQIFKALRVFQRARGNFVLAT